MPTDLASRTFERILLIKPSSLGDVVHALPVLHGLRCRYPRARLSWLVSTGCLPLLDGHPQIDELIPFDRRRYGRMLQSPTIAAEFLGFVRSLRSRAFDLVIDLQGLFRSGFMAWASGAGVRIGFAAAREFAWLFYSHRIVVAGPDEHAVDRNYGVSRMLGFADVPVAFPLPVQPQAVRNAAALLAELGVAPGERYAVAVPGARWDTKIWPAARFAAVADHLHRTRGLRTVVVGGGDERPQCEAVAAAAGSPVANACGRTSLADLVALLDGAGIVVTNDSGPMHIAVALGRPVVCVVGPTNARRTGPYGSKNRVVNTELPCSPCYLRRVAQCRFGHACMQDLAALEVQAAVDSLLNQG